MIRVPKLITAGLSFLMLVDLFGAKIVSAQLIVPATDGVGTRITSPIDNSTQFNISGGTQAGANLYQSFQRFGLSQGQTATFLSNPTIVNILGRVTGGDASVINGLVQVTGGNSNLFLMNPAGMVFGRGASLNVPGSFTATTANGIAIGSHWFNATGANDFANLSGPPNGFGFLSNPGAIVNAGDLSVNAGQSLTLLGGTVINTGTITAPGGNITIAAVPGGNLVRISQAGSLLSMELPLEARSSLNSPAIAPLSLPELLTVGNTASATGVTVDNGGVKLTRTDAAIPTAPGTTIVDGLLSADATGLGNGGNVHVLGEQTQFFGNITARGGSMGGDGGFVDTSGYRSLLIAPEARVITTAPLGQTGTWLIDPADLTVVAAGGTAAIGGGTNTPVAAATINAGTIVTGLNGTNINLQATNSITVNAAIDTSANAAAGNLSLQAPIANLNQPITLRTGSTLSGTANVVNVGTAGRVQNGVDVAAAGGTVNLAAATYILPDQVVIDKDLTVQGQGAPNTTLSGNNAFRIFLIQDALGAGVSTIAVTLNDLTVANGNVGDANGGGILSNGILTINNSTVRDNVALRSGGGIRSNGILTVNNSTISGNSAGVGVLGEGGGILSFGSSLTVTNSTISGNSAIYGGGIENYGVAIVRNSTVIGNSANFGGGFDSRNGTSTTVVTNSIVGGNQASVTGTEVDNSFGTFTSNGYNLVGQNGSAGGFPTAASDIILAGAINTAINPTLANNGGSTQTHALVAGSPAIDAGDPTSTLALDPRGGQRGTAGIDSGNRIDIGAYEATSSYLVTRSADDTNIGSLRAAINFANINTNPVTANPLDTVRFGIATTDPGYVAATNSWSIAPTFALPTVTQAVIVDATTQPGYTTRPAIELNGTNAGLGVNGLTITAGNSTMRGFAINRFNSHGILLQTNGGNTITENFVGTDVTGTLNQGNGDSGININSVANTTIGGGTPGVGNLISSNVGNGILVNGVGATGTSIQGNRIGLDVTGTVDLGNGREGVRVTNGASNTLIGTNADGLNDAGERNIISGNYRANDAILPDNANIRVDTNANNTRIAGNYVGTNASGIAIPTGRPNGGVRGVQVFNASNTTIGGTTAAERNIISGNTHFGAEIVGTNLGNRIIGNYIGTDVTGNSPIANGNGGVQIYFAANTTVGGINPGEGNLISGNTNNGIVIVGDTNTRNNSVLGNLIGTNAAGTAALRNGLDGIQVINAPNNTIGGTTTAARNVISGSGRIGIALFGTATGNTVQGNYIGTDRTGNIAIANGSGLYIDASSNTIGGGTVGAGNLISGNSQQGILLAGNGNSTTIQGNLIGTNVTGAADLNNGGTGVAISGASNTLLGTNADGVNDANERNVISGNDRQGNSVGGANANVQIFNAINTRVAGNYIGTNATGTALPTGQTTGGVRGIQIRNSGNTTIGGSTAAERNLISGNQHMGIEFVGGGTTGQVIGNYIGTDITGNSAISNGTGVSTFFANNQTIGGVNPGEGNLISGNTNDGLSFVGNSSTNNRVIGNRIGTNAAGTAALGNGNGVRIFLGANNQIGTDGDGVNDAAERNLISGNTGAGISIQNASNNRIAGNSIGVGANGSTAIGNAQDGVVITNAANNAITNNLITTNGRGVAIVGATSTGNSVLGNSIFGNGTIGIDLDRNGITPNSTPSSANNSQAFPLLISATGNTVTGLLNSTPSTTYRLEFFSSATTDQGQTFLGTVNVTTDAAGIVNFSAPVSAIPAGVQVSATATNLTTGSTSEFSAAPSITFSPTGGTLQSTVVNTPFSTALQGTVLDSRGNPAGGVAVNFAAPAAGATATLTGTVITNLFGQANNLTTANTIAGAYTVTATATGAPTTASFSLTNRPDVPATIALIGGTPQTATVNTAFAAALRVNVRDQFGNIVPGATVNFAAPVSGASAALSSATVITDGLGNASVSVEANTIAGTYSLSGTSGSATPGSFSLTNSPDAPASITPLSGTPQTTIVNTAFANPLEVQVKDQYGNPVSNSTITFSVPTTGASGQFSNATATTNPNGVASVNLTANLIAGSFTSSSSVAGVAAPAQFALTNAPGAPASLTALSNTNQSTMVNTAYPEELRAIVRDAFGNPLSNAPVTFTFPTRGASGQFANGATITLQSDSSGIVALPLSANTISGTYSAIARVNGSDLSFNLTNNPGAPAFINAIGGDGQTTLVTRAFRRSLQVRVTDVFGNLLSGIPLNFSPPTTGASGQFSGSSIVITNPNGIATAPELTANAIAGRYTIAVSTSGLTVTPFRLNNSPVPDENRLTTDLQGKPLRQAEPRPLKLLPILCAERRVPEAEIDEYRDLPNCPQRLPVDEETRRSAPVLRKTD